jgi:hypothetical protein
MENILLLNYQNFSRKLELLPELYSPLNSKHTLDLQHITLWHYPHYHTDAKLGQLENRINLG